MRRNRSLWRSVSRPTAPAPSGSAEKLDRDRIASMADEGGAAAAEVEAQPGVADPLDGARRRGSTSGILLLSGAVMATALLLARWTLLARRRAARGRSTGRVRPAVDRVEREEGGREEGKR